VGGRDVVFLPRGKSTICQKLSFTVDYEKIVIESGAQINKPNGGKQNVLKTKIVCLACPTIRPQHKGAVFFSATDIFEMTEKIKSIRSERLKI